MASAGAAVGSAPGRRFPGSPQSESDRPADRASRCRMWSRECRHQHPAPRCLPPDDDPHMGGGHSPPGRAWEDGGIRGARNWGAGLIERGVADRFADLLRIGGEPMGCASGERGPASRGGTLCDGRAAGSRPAVGLSPGRRLRTRRRWRRCWPSAPPSARGRCGDRRPATRAATRRRRERGPLRPERSVVWARPVFPATPLLRCWMLHGDGKA